MRNRRIDVRGRVAAVPVGRAHLVSSMRSPSRLMRQKRLRRTSYVPATSAGSIGDLLRPASCVQKIGADESVKMHIIACLRLQTQDPHFYDLRPYSTLRVQLIIVQHLHCAGCAGKEGRSCRLLRQSRAAEVAARFLVASEERTSLVSIYYVCGRVLALAGALQPVVAAQHKHAVVCLTCLAIHLPNSTTCIDR